MLVTKVTYTLWFHSYAYTPVGCLNCDGVLDKLTTFLKTAHLVTCVTLERTTATKRAKNGSGTTILECDRFEIFFRNID